MPDMSQKSFTTTTSFIVSSDESLNKPTLSSSQSTDSGDNVTRSESVQSNQYFVSLNPVVNNNMALDQQHNRLQASGFPPQPSYPTQTPIYAPLPPPPPPPPLLCRDGVSTSNQLQQHQQSNSQTNLNGNQCNGTGTDYSLYNGQNNNQSQILNASAESQSNNNPALFVNSIQFRQSYSPGGDLHVTTNQTSPASSDATSAPLAQNHWVPNGTQQHQNNSIYGTNGAYSPKSNPSVQSFQTTKQATSGQRSSISSLDSPVSSALMPINVKGMLLHGVPNHEVIRNWLKSIKCEEYLNNFIDSGYDMALLTRMTPQDLTAIGCKSPALRKKLLLEIKKLNLEDDIPECRPDSLERWLEILKLSEYHSRLCDEGYTTIDKVCELTWEDLEEIGINKLGHQKRLLLGIERIQKFDKQQEERQNDHAIYDIHPNHRISLNQGSDNRLSTLSRSTVRSGFFQTRSGANLDHRGLPVATVMPALKHVTNSLANLDIANQVISTNDGSTKNTLQNTNGYGNNRLSSNDQNNQSQPIYQANNQEHGLKMSDLSATMKRNPPPLPPVRTNSLKFPQDSVGHFNNNSIYGNSFAIPNKGGNFVPISTGSTSFLRTPKLGTLTATTNKMLTSGGHIQTVNGHHSTTTTIRPVREAPLPPIPTQPLPPIIQGKIEEETHMSMHNFSNACNSIGGSTLISSSSIGHQLASADEFPPPPPSQ